MSSLSTYCNSEIPKMSEIAKLTALAALKICNHKHSEHSLNFSHRSSAFIWVETSSFVAKPLSRLNNYELSFLFVLYLTNF